MGSDENNKNSGEGSSPENSGASQLQAIEGCAVGHEGVP